MHIISKTALKEFWEKNPYAKDALISWYKITSKSQWQCFQDVRQTFDKADFVGQLTVFNICRNNYRLITKINFRTGKVYIRAVLTHAEYDRNLWKKDSWFSK
ncbi:type II toxin-antitoxin system HigB family toxin [Geminocystis herdmanii]|uniref:type II toxin-antitoxin system HigB family toxin n=1 Tax=Geminocystis herdmanii TaxID=669359 RepID=UPI000348AED7|nr:type II toxin-antitoxin system HigB family toxin [Geminocystis herdmanii]